MARWRPSSNQVTLTSFSRSRRSFKVTTWNMVSAQYLNEYLIYPHLIWYTEALGQEEDRARTGWPWPHFQGHRGHLRRWHEIWFPHNISRNIWLIFTKFGTLKHQGKKKIKLESGDLDPIFKVTEVIQGDGIWKMVSAQYVEKYLMYPHQIWYTGAPSKMKTKFEMGNLDLIFKVTEVI